MAKYTYKQENNKYVFYKDGKPLTNPHGIVITTDNEELAKKMEEADYVTLKQEFLDDLEEFECDELGEDPDDKAYVKHLKEIGDMIDTFVYYFTLGV
jgi:hypothetical protein